MRALVVIWRLGPFVLSFLRDRRRWWIAGEPIARSEEFHQDRAERLVAVITALGPSFVKMAQVFSARADLIPEPYITVLSSLTDQVPPVPTALIEHEIEKAYGRPVRTVFERFDGEPLAAASLGQVHRASFQGEEVVVKVLRPGVEQLVRKDLAALRPIMQRVERLFPNPHVRNARTVIEEFGVRIWEEMDLVHEAANAVEILKNFRTHTRVIVPRVIHELVRKRVIVLQYVEGTRVDRLMPHGGDKAQDPHGVVSTVMELYLRMMLVHGFFHADPHPGNLLVAADGRVVLLDFGMVVRVPREMRWHLVSTVFAAIRRDVDGIVAGFRSLGVIEPGADPDRIRALAARLMAIAYDPRSMQERIQLVANEVVAELYDWPVRLPSELVYFARTTTLIEGLGVRYDRHFNPITFAAPIAIRLRGEILHSLGQGEAPPIDMAAAFGAILGRVATVVVHAGRDLMSRLSNELGHLGSTIMPLTNERKNGTVPPVTDVPKLLAGD
jgi:predicted unusual protein kinase regulating ubiquinone biosynthesis (AarF/ABC1/UbiB family)